MASYSPLQAKAVSVDAKEVNDYVLHCVSDYLPFTLKLRFCMHLYIHVLVQWPDDDL
jgi:peroxiredoxin